MHHEPRRVLRWSACRFRVGAVPLLAVPTGFYLAIRRRSVGASYALGILYRIAGCVAFVAFLLTASDMAQHGLDDEFASMVVFHAILIAYLCAVGRSCYHWGHRLDRWYSRRAPRCPACDYNLRGLNPHDSPTCPECGADIVELLGTNASQRSGE